MARSDLLVTLALSVVLYVAPGFMSSEVVEDLLLPRLLASHAHPSKVEKDRGYFQLLIHHILLHDCSSLAFARRQVEL